MQEVTPLPLPHRRGTASARASQMRHIRYVRYQNTGGRSDVLTDHQNIHENFSTGGCALHVWPRAHASPSERLTRRNVLHGASERATRTNHCKPLHGGSLPGPGDAIRSSPAAVKADGAQRKHDDDASATAEAQIKRRHGTSKHVSEHIGKQRTRSTWRLNANVQWVFLKRILGGHQLVC